MRLATFVSIAALLLACTTYRDQLARSQRHFEQSQYEETLGLLRDLERDFTSLSQPEQAQYAYLRGMTDYRVGYRPDARHWLSLAKAYDESSPGVLPADWKARLTEALEEMNGVVYEGGMRALASSPKATDTAEPASSKKTTPKAKP